MIPKKANKLYIEVAEDLNVSESLVETFIEAYYKEARECLIQLKYPRINMDGLGHFVAKKGLVKLNIPRIQKILENHDVSTFKAYYRKKGLEVKLDQLILLQEKIMEEENRKEIFKKNKNESSTKDNLGE